MEDTNKDCSKKLSPCVAGILGASLVANLFLAGLASVPLMKMHHRCEEEAMRMPPPPPPGMAFMIKRIEHELPAQDAAAIHDLGAKTEADLENSTKERDAAFAALGETIKANPLDEAAVQKALDDVSAAHTKTEATMSGFIKEAVTKLSTEGRKVLAEKGLPPPRGKMGPPGFMPGMDMKDMHSENGPDHHGLMPPPNNGNARG